MLSVLFNLAWLLGPLAVAYWWGSRLEQSHEEALLHQEKALEHIQLLNLKTTPTERTDLHLVSGSAVYSSDYFRDTWALLLGLTGRNVEPYERLIDRTRREAFVRLKQQAAEHGADTVVAIHVQTTSMDLPKIMACEVLVYGSAYRSL